MCVCRVVNGISCTSAFFIFIKTSPLEQLVRVAFGFLALGFTAAVSWAAAGAGAFSAAGCPDFGVFLAGRPGDFYALKKGAMLARPCAAAAASVFENF
jgi:hypothetical protein